MRADGAILIFTEGKTDQMYIKKAIAGTELDGRCVFPRLANGKGGFGVLDKLYEVLQNFDGDAVKIFIYDGDGKPSWDPLERGTNHTYRFTLPLPSHRSPGDMICIEHYFTDEQIKTRDENGRRLFLAGEFDDEGVCADGNERYLSLHMRSQRILEREGSGVPDPLQILDGNGAYKVTCPGSEKNMGLPKSVFARYVLEGHEGFGFPLGEFARIVDEIRDVLALDARSDAL